jgi:myosin heavy subunit
MNQKTINYLGAAIIALLILGLIVAIGKNTKNRKSLANEKSISETLLVEKQKFETDLEKLRADLSALRQQSDANEKLFSESRLKIDESDKRINSLTRDNRALRNNASELEELKKTKEELEKEFAQLKSDNDRLLTQTKNLESSINSLEAEKSKLADQVQRTQLYNTDNFLVTATRGKKTERVVICASRAKKLNMTFEVPQSLTEEISFKIVTPTGTTVNSDDTAISWFIRLDSRNFTASLSPVTGEFEESRQVVLSYSPKSKLAKGEYRIQILSNGNNIGNCRMILK